MKLHFFVFLIFCNFLPKLAYTLPSFSGPLYVGDATDGRLYFVDSQTGEYGLVTQFSGSFQFHVDAAIANKNTAYVLTENSMETQAALYSVNLRSGSTQLISPTPIPCDRAFAISILNSSTAYFVCYGDNTVRSINLLNGQSSVLTTISPGASPNPGIADICIANRTTAYVVGYNDNNVYSVNLETGSYQLVTPTAVASPSNPSLAGITLTNNTTAYVSGNNNDNVYVVDLLTGSSELLTPTPIGSPVMAYIGGIVPGSRTGYTQGVGDDKVYAFNFETGASSTLTTISGMPELVGICAYLQISTLGLTSNNLSLTNYLNANTPIDLIRLFALLPDLNAALESTAPTRNTLATFASQTGYLAASQILSDHGRQKRFQSRMNLQQEMAASSLPQKRLFVDASDVVQEASSSSEQPTPCHEDMAPVSQETTTASDQTPSSTSSDDTESTSTDPGQSHTDSSTVAHHTPPRDCYTVWATPFGEYAKEKAQHQTPAFSMSSGGVVVGCDFNGHEGNLVGLGGAYVYTHIHEDDNQGHANLNQGYLTVYGTAHARNWYFDLGLWGGYYNAFNQRNIQFPGVDETAKTRIQGWQLAPHFEMGYDGYWLKNGILEWFGLEPFLMLDWVANWEDNAKEWGAGDFNMGQEGRFCSLLRTETGLRFHETLHFDWGLITLREKGSYAYQKAFGTGSLNAFLLGYPGSFTVNTLTTAQNLGVVEFAMLFAFVSKYAPYVDVRYQGEFGSKYQSHQGVVELGKSF